MIKLSVAYCLAWLKKTEGKILKKSKPKSGQSKRKLSRLANLQFEIGIF